MPKSGTKKAVRGETLDYLIIALEEMEAFSKDISIDACWSAIQELKVPIVLSRMIQVKYHDLNETRRNLKDKTETKNKDLPKPRIVINDIKNKISLWDLHQK